jgi:hypothetical protein
MIATASSLDPSGSTFEHRYHRADQNQNTSLHSNWASGRLLKRAHAAADLQWSLVDARRLRRTNNSHAVARYLFQLAFCNEDDVVRVVLHLQ